MKSRSPSLMVAILGVSLMGGAAQADTMMNGSINFDGNPLNYYDPANGFVPAGYSNSSGLPITVPGDFGFLDGANQDTATFTTTSLAIEDITFSTASNWTQTFTATTPGFFTGLLLTSDTFVNGVTYTLVADTLTVQWGGTGTPGTGIADFSFGVPGPVAGAGLPGLGTALAFGALVAWRRRRRSSDGFDRRGAPDGLAMV